MLTYDTKYVEIKLRDDINMLAQSFLPAPIQSVTLRDLGVAVPPSIMVNDLRNVVAMKTRRRSADEYLQNVKSKRKTSEVVTVEDVVEAERFLFGSSMAVIIPQVTSAVALLQNNEVLLAIQDLGTRIDNRLDRIDTRLSNSSAYDPGDTIIPPKLGEVDPPAAFPRTIQALTGLNDLDLLSRLEEYYTLPHRGALKARIRRVLRAYGIGVTITTADTRVIY